MKETKLVNKPGSPNLIGGIGGSGTRVVTEILIKMGFFMGGDLNNSKDYLRYGLAGKLRELKSSKRGITDDSITKYIHDKLDQIEMDITSEIGDHQPCIGWGWKVPGNFYLLEHANTHFTDIKYIHVIRHGLDMAFSSNQNQLRNWSGYFDIDISNLPLPVASLRYWIKANTFATTLGIRLFQERFHLLSFDDLVIDTERTIKALSKFLGIECEDMEELVGIVHKPKSVGRYREKDISIFSNADIQRVVDFGFQV